MTTTRVERDRHFLCVAGEPCRAPAPSARRLQGRPVGACIPRRSWWLRTVNNAGRRVSLSFRSELEAQEAARKVEAARVLGQDYNPRGEVEPHVPTFAKVAEEALRLHQQSRPLRPGTLIAHRKILRGRLLPAFGSKPMTPENFSRLELRRFIAQLRDPETGLSDSTITTYLPTLRLVLDHAVELALLLSNPMSTGGRLWHHQAGAEVDPFTCSELRRILQAARPLDRDFGTLVQTMAQTGLRPGEALGLRREDVDLQTGMAHVRGSWSLAQRQRGPTKTKKNTRTVSLLHPVLEDREVWKPAEAGIETHQVLDGLGVLQAVAPDREAPLFPSSSLPTKPMGSREFYTRWRRILTAAKIPYRKPHTLRHAFASILLSRGANLLYIVRVGGWTNANTLLRVYSKWVEEASDASSATSRDLTPRLSRAGQISA